ncbi:chromosome segregation protein SMC [Amaricoccus sp.]|uniref:chromosome segregation protein SMC n=1 Tax=Amaricoccus sp. TaxID=1872485 RepID=UPI001B5D169D|nr:chromosome segregation protein SMC [Amaricoccus sp.]MBP7242571.1 chromosome segregation protein SMC [Amaricoccus sp.]
MQFTRLRLAGFKSFVDPTELVINTGLTGVVGPNGCGKSNLLEAVRWAMGESRPTAMRGDGMEDVIFAGSSTRPARGHAEVTLTIDNRDRVAPAGFNDADTLEITRRITRDAGSVFRVNGREARARDVAMLFADASTGAQSPALVRQGQISELINARPKARRRVLEEAAGIAGLHQRRHEAELKLRAAEANLGRVGDVLEALEAQISALARQARTAARYREIAEALRRAEGLALWRLWRDAEDERAVAATALTETVRAAAATTAEASEASRARAAAEEAVPPAREEDTVAAAVLQRATIERERLDAAMAEAERRIAELKAALAQIETDREREAALDRDAHEMDARLAAERVELEAAGEGHEAALAAARMEAERAAAALRMVEAAFDAAAESAARLAAEHQAATARQVEARKREAEAARALQSADAALASAEAEMTRSGEARAAAATASETAAGRAEAAETALAGAEAAAFAARAADTAAQSARAAAEGALKALAAETAGLERSLARPKGAASPVIDALRVAPGCEAALGAALADDLAQPAVGAAAATGWLALDALEPAPLPEGAAPLAAHVSAPPELARRLAAIGLVDRADGPRLQALLAPGQRLVSREGDLWRWDGLRLAAGAASGAAAERLRQQNRLAELRRQLAEAEAAAAGAAQTAAAAAADLSRTATAEQSARAARRAAETALAEATRALTRAEAAAEQARARAEGLRSGRRRRAEEAEAAAQARAATDRACAELADPSEARGRVDAERLKVEAARIAMMTRRAAAEELDRAGAARAKRLTDIARETEGWRTRRANAADRLATLDRRAAETGAALATAREEPGALAVRRAGIAETLADAEARRRRASDTLALAETALKERDAALRAAEKAAAEAGAARARAEAVAEAAETRAVAAVDRVRAEAEVEPADLLARFQADPDRVPAAADLDAEAQRLRRARDGLGAVNLRAEEDARAVQTEFDTLSAERTEIEEAIRKLRQGIANLNREGRGRLLAAFEEVNRNFAILFKRLFGGGEATLTLVESDDPLEAGLEIMCQPPGKKLATLSLLSGGEQTLTALSLIFAVFLANPSPICVLDEVDAPLDDANVGRFCDMMDEMTGRTATRFLVITHHAVTMSRMDRLFGVTMAEPGVSQLVSVDLAGAERLVDTAA